MLRMERKKGQKYERISREADPERYVRNPGWQKSKKSYNCVNGENHEKEKKKTSDRSALPLYGNDNGAVGIVGGRRGKKVKSAESRT